MEKIVELIYLALVVWCVSASVARAKVFEPLRRWILPIDDEDDLYGEAWKAYADWSWKLRAMLWELVSCQRCLAHWVALLTCWLFPVQIIVSQSVIVSWIGNWFLVVAVNDLIARQFGPRCGLRHMYSRKNPK